jgi:hypothetical protein
VPVGDDEEGGAMIDRLASVLVRLKFVAVDARALEALLEVVADLRAASWRVAFIEVGASDGVIGQHLALGAGADGARRRLLAGVGAEAGLVLALGQVAAGTLVGAVRAIWFAVAHRGQVHAAPAHTGTLPLAGVTTRNGRSARVTCVLVRVVTAIVLSIAYVRLGGN